MKVYLGHTKGVVPSFSAGSLNGCKLTSTGKNSVVFATDNCLFFAQIATEEGLEPSSGSFSYHYLYFSTILSYRTPLDYEIHSLTSYVDDTKKLVGASDGDGNAFIIYKSGNRQASWTIRCEKTLNNIGWSGLSFVPTQDDEVVIAKGFQRNFSLWKEDRLVQKWKTAAELTNLKHLPLGSTREGLFVLTEDESFSAWDLRSSECVYRGSPLAMNNSRGKTIYALSTSQNYVTVGSLNQTISLYDVKKWSLQSKFSSSLKQDLVSLHQIPDDKSYFAISTSNELGRCENHQKKAVHENFQAESRWIGFTTQQQQLWGLTQNGVLHLFTQK